MASHGCSRVWMRCPHSHHQQQQQHCPHCPLHRHCRHCPLHHHNPISSQPPPHLTSLPQSHNPHLSPLNPPVTSHAQISQELEHIELDDEEEDDEPVFVLTDEWREFFAKSEARRKLEKKQGKKGKK